MTCSGAWLEPGMRGSDTSGEPARTKRATSRALAIIAAHVFAKLLCTCRRRRAAFVSSAIFLHGIFNGQREAPISAAR